MRGGCFLAQVLHVSVSCELATERARLRQGATCHCLRPNARLTPHFVVSRLRAVLCSVACCAACRLAPRAAPQHVPRPASRAIPLSACRSAARPASRCPRATARVPLRIASRVPAPSPRFAIPCRSSSRCTPSRAGCRWPRACRQAIGTPASRSPSARRCS